VRRVALAAHVRDYAVRAVLSTHPRGHGRPGGEGGDDAAARGGEFATPMVNQYVRIGASPRAAQALILGGKVRALLDARAAVSIDDIRAVALPSLRHRMILNFEGEAEGVTTDAIVENIVATLPREAPGD